MRVLFILMFLISPFSFGAPALSGYWAVKCGGFGGNVQVSSSGDVKININDNNLLISARLYDDSSKSILYYQDVIESNNDTIDWGNISKSKAIAVISMKNNELNLSWRGFYDQKRGHYVWVNGPDFVVASGSNNIKLKKCEFK